MMLFSIPSLVVLQLHLLTSVVTSQTYTTELIMKYFTSVSMLCDNPALNLTARSSDIRSMTWIFPDGQTIDSTRKPDRTLFKLTGPNHNLKAYNLTALSISDSLFGYYICVVVYQSEAVPISVIKWGLNVQGVDFSELIQTYEENAIVGGIAAGAMLAAIGAACLIWHFRYNNRHPSVTSHWEEKSADDSVCLADASGRYNESYIAQDEITDKGVKSEAGGSNSVVKTEVIY